MKTDWFSRVGPWLAWSLLAFVVISMGAGLTLQVITDAPFGGVPFIIHFSEVIAPTGFAIVGALIVSRHPKVNVVGGQHRINMTASGLSGGVYDASRLKPDDPDQDLPKNNVGIRSRKFGLR
jgi:hypothetical protein